MTEAKTTPKAKKVEEPPLNIYQRLNAISQEAGALAPEAKNGVPFAFRGIDGTVAHLTPFMHKYGVIVLPTVLEKVVSKRELTSGKVVTTTDLVVKYTFVGPDGDSVEVVSAGLADDFADRSTAQAMSVAMRIALLQAFHLPTHAREPEETGQEVMNNAAPSVPKAVATAQGASRGGGGGGLLKLQASAKSLGKQLDMGPDDLNAMGQRIGNGNADWYATESVLEAMVKELEAKAKAESK